ncbi:MAG: hypothetical protein K8R41_02845 [Bacteroidales bacterium]|nr:hypothetical protein [Bacteroidales bacterium]
MKKICLLLMILFFSIALIAQKEYIEINKNYSTARIYKKDYKIIKVTSLKLTNDTLVTFKNLNSQKLEQLSVKYIKYFSIKDGSKALTYGLLGAGSGLLGSLLGVLEVKADPYLDDSNVNYAPIIIGITAGFGIIGAFIGAFHYKWKRLYIKDDKSSYSIMISPTIQSNYCSLGLYINF